MLDSHSVGITLLHACLDDALFAIKTGNKHRAIFYLKAARHRLEELEGELKEDALMSSLSIALKTCPSLISSEIRDH